MENLIIPEKSHFKLSEVCEIVSVKPYVLRFWESEFDEISPIVSSSGQKLYQHRDIEAIAYIKKLLFIDKLTVEKAKHVLTQQLSQPPELSNLDCDEVEDQKETLPHDSHQSFSEIKENLYQLLSLSETIQKKYEWR